MKTGLTKKQKVTEVFYNAKDPAAEIYTHDTKLKKRLQTLQDVGLGYVKLGQPSTTLSGGEANFTLADADITALLGK